MKVMGTSPNLKRKEQNRGDAIAKRKVKVKVTRPEVWIMEALPMLLEWMR